MPCPSYQEVANESHTVSESRSARRHCGSAARLCGAPRSRRTHLKVDGTRLPPGFLASADLTSPPPPSSYCGATPASESKRTSPRSITSNHSASPARCVTPWGPGKYDAEFNRDGINSPVVIPPALGL